MPAHAADPKAHDHRRPRTPAVTYRVAWLVLLGVLGLAQLVAVRTIRTPLDYLSATMWWAYGDRYSARWWFIGLPVLTLLVWAGVHWLFGEVNDRHLAWGMGGALVVAAVGWVVTR